MSDLTYTQVIEILHNPERYEWSVQGFGMLRAWLDPEGVQRLHIWDTDQSYETAPSTVHNHPWDFTSRLYFGSLRNERHVISENGIPHRRATIRTGQGGGLLTELEPIKLLASEPEFYGPGDTYEQEAPEIHESYPIAGTVTLIARKFRFDRKASVYWPVDSEWVTAEPRPATDEEIKHFIGLALTRT